MYTNSLKSKTILAVGALALMGPAAASAGLNNGYVTHTGYDSFDDTTTCLNDGEVRHVPLSQEVEAISYNPNVYSSVVVQLIQLAAAEIPQNQWSEWEVRWHVVSGTYFDEATQTCQANGEGYETFLGVFRISDGQQYYSGMFSGGGSRRGY